MSKTGRGYFQGLSLLALVGSVSVLVWFHNAVTYTLAAQLEELGASFSKTTLVWITGYQLAVTWLPVTLMVVCVVVYLLFFWRRDSFLGPKAILVFSVCLMLFIAVFMAYEYHDAMQSFDAAIESMK